MVREINKFDRQSKTFSLEDKIIEPKRIYRFACGDNRCPKHEGGKYLHHSCGDKYPKKKHPGPNLKCREINRLRLTGTKRPEEIKKRISETSKKNGVGLWMTGRNAGEKSRFWKGGITPELMKIRGSAAYKAWRRAVFTRDNFTCVLCGAHNGNGKTVELNADHIKPFFLYPELRLELSNGRTLCKECHLKTDTHGYTFAYRNAKLV